MRTQRFVVRNAGDLGRVISQARALTGESQADLAERIGVERTYLSRMEGGLETVHLPRVLAALRALGVRLEGSLDLEDDTDHG